MNKSPVICFYQENQFISSEDYLYLECPFNQDPSAFLKEIEKNFYKKMKIVSIHFNAFSEQTNQPIVTQDCLIQVYILNKYSLHHFQNFLPDSNLNYRLNFKPDIQKNDFCNKIELIKSDIKKGRYYQVNFTSSFSSPHSISNQNEKMDLFKYYFKKFDSPYCAFLPGSIYDTLCFSPELFLKKEKTAIITQPIKGTLHSKEINDLRKSEKEASELSMIVDLLRNDLQQICTGPVQVTQHRSEMKLSYTTHTFSEIKGSTNKSFTEIIQAMSPGGSISGCPKKESLKAINELESHQRHFYTGSIGWWQDSDFTLNLAIRSFMLLPDQMKYFTGCGIVYDSQPKQEWVEFLTKAKPLDLL